MNIDKDIKKAESKGYKYYVYHLKDSNNQTFYVGKGSGKRYSMHVKDAAKNKGSNIVKMHKIKEIGLKNVKASIIAYFQDENEAYNAERQEMQRIGLKNLTNHSKQNYKISKYIEEQSKIREAQTKLYNLKPFYLWVLEMYKYGVKINNELLKLYWKIIDKLVYEAKWQDYRKDIRYNKYHSYNNELETERPIKYMKFALKQVIS